MVRPQLLAEWGIPHQVVVAAGAADVAAGAIAIGAINDGDQLVSLGTSAQIFVARDRYRPNPDALLHAFTHGVPGRWYEMAATLNGASCLDWLARVLGESDVDRLLNDTEAEFRGPSPVVFLPHLSGERTPFNDADARGAFAGLDQASGRSHLVQAVIEGVALSLKEAELSFGGKLGAEPIPIIGGGARSAVWMLVLASVLGRPLLKLAGRHIGPAFGAARLARLAATGAAVADVCTQPALLDIVDPHPALQEAYQKRLETSRALYGSLKRLRQPPAATADRRRRARH
jgi:xylulokinase